MKSREKTVKIDAEALSSHVENGNGKGESADVGFAMVEKVKVLLQKEVDGH